MRKYLLLYFKGLLMGAADIVPGVSGGTMALITGIYKELISSIDQISLKQIGLLQKEGFTAFWKGVKGSFLLPLFLGIASGIIFLSGAITYLLDQHLFYCGRSFLVLSSPVFMCSLNNSPLKHLRIIVYSS